MTEVVVFSTGSPVEMIGVGHMRRENIPVVDDEDESKILYVLEDHPVITIDETGEIMYGIDCWWMPLGDFVTARQKMITAYGGEKDGKIS